MSIIRCFNCEQQLDSDFVEFQQYEDNDWCLTCYEDKMEALEEEALKLYGNPYDKKTGYLRNHDPEIEAQGLIDNPKGERGAK